MKKKKEKEGAPRRDAQPHERITIPGVAANDYVLSQGLSYPHWGTEIEEEAHEQMRNACQLPIAAFGALMPDAHVGYGLPIGGVLATRNAVIPYAVGVDIACRVKLSVLDLPPAQLTQQPQRFSRALSEHTSFGIGASWKKRKRHEVMDLNWKATQITAELKDVAWSQLGTSGSGNHFVEFGEITFGEEFRNLAPGTYLGLVSHSGSRGAGSRVADHFVRRARRNIHNFHDTYSTWLDMNGDGAEYWQAMELMGAYASANHELIHQDLLHDLGATPLLQVENHHNFAWREEHFGEEVIVHRKGATPAAKGVLGYIPGTMSDPGFLVEGLGDARSLHSSSHGAGRQMSRSKAKATITPSALKERLRDNNVTVLSCGLDESPQAYKDIESVMKAQVDLVRTIARFQPRLVKMAGAGEKPED